MNRDLSLNKQKVRAIWQATSYAKFATCLETGLDDFISRLNIHAEHQVLDVACGSGNFALLAARRGATVTGLDFNPDALAVARTRAKEANVTIQFDEGDIEQMPYLPNTFDWVVSVFGIMFALNSEAAAQEVVRVCKPSGKIVIASWTEDGLVGQLAKIMVRYKSESPGTSRSSGWGDEHQVQSYLGNQNQPDSINPSYVAI